LVSAFKGHFVKKVDNAQEMSGWHKPCHYELIEEGGAEWHSS
jgi:hypothetical protein